jgi:hypothetical protein
MHTTLTQWHQKVIASGVKQHLSGQHDMLPLLKTSLSSILGHAINTNEGVIW